MSIEINRMSIYFIGLPICLFCISSWKSGPDDTCRSKYWHFANSFTLQGSQET